MIASSIAIRGGRRSVGRWLLGMSLRLGLWCLAALPAGAAKAVIDVGETAPKFTLETLDGRGDRTLDDKTTHPTMLLFVKPDDKFTSDGLASLDHLFARQPELGKNLERWIVVSRRRPGNAMARLKSIVAAHPQWTALLDAEDKLYADYSIVATPTIVLVGTDHKVDATHPGYDPGMEQNVRLALAKLEGVKLPDSATGPVAPPNLRLQMASRLLARGLFDRALPYYLQVAGEGPLPPSAMVELAEIYLRQNRPDDALAWLNKVPADSAVAARVPPMKARARALKAGRPDPAVTPVARLRNAATTPSASSREP